MHFIHDRAHDDSASCIKPFENIEFLNTGWERKRQRERGTEVKRKKISIRLLIWCAIKKPSKSHSSAINQQFWITICTVIYLIAKVSPFCLATRILIYTCAWIWTKLVWNHMVCENGKVSWRDIINCSPIYYANGFFIHLSKVLQFICVQLLSVGCFGVWRLLVGRNLCKNHDE